MIQPKAIEAYIQQLTPLDQPLLLELEKVAREEKIPIIQRTSIQLIRMFLLHKGDLQRILEIGTAIGYSTIWLAEAAPLAYIDTLERDPGRAKQALTNLDRANLSHRVHVHLTDAKGYAAQLNQTYDLIFIDAAKGQYQHFFEEYAPLLRPHGLIVSDNILFQGYVIQEKLENKRIRPMVEKIKTYNQWLSDHPDFVTSFVPIGDGLAFSYRRQ